ncbi:peptidylprolyl isomerase [Salinarimonas sp.]|uniref:peptidylprolyl isomerase n=1 Tax=Salinarimonas sp. TaxID=2766526 RepID=UPI0032D96145
MSRFPLLPRLALALALGASASTLAFAQQDQAAETAAPAAPAAAEVDPDAVVATVDGVTITEADLALVAEDPALPLPGMSAEQRRDVLIGYLVDLKLAARAAENAGLAETETFARNMAYQRDKVLLAALLEETIAAAVTEEAARALYEETVAGIEPQEEVRARHILVPTEEEAKAAAERVAAGEDFAAVAAELSQDPGSAREGGDLGFFTRDRMVAPFAEAAFALEPGGVSEPVQSQFGWHVIKVEERREQPTPAFEDMREQIETFLARRAQQELILSLRDGATVERPGQDPADGEAPAQAQ